MRQRVGSLFFPPILITDAICSTSCACLLRTYSLLEKVHNGVAIRHHEKPLLYKNFLLSLFFHSQPLQHLIMSYGQQVISRYLRLSSDCLISFLLSRAVVAATLTRYPPTARQPTSCGSSRTATSSPVSMARLLISRAHLRTRVLRYAINYFLQFFLLSYQQLAKFIDCASFSNTCPPAESLSLANLFLRFL